MYLYTLIKRIEVKDSSVNCRLSFYPFSENTTVTLFLTIHKSMMTIALHIIEIFALLEYGSFGSKKFYKTVAYLQTLTYHQELNLKRVEK